MIDSNETLLRFKTLLGEIFLIPEKDYDKDVAEYYAALKAEDEIAIHTFESKWIMVDD